ncbi:uncharacterized protein LOC118478755 [Aplysia californica]|uniref:Uncharacterized protein LOC118478755 n=1 Tax=Aplysia californica TaxID=6500 RepID=A0ABM1W2C0_APLCA|nr:uncharacterized protein LOC118478755 [Aplysia californica]
MMMVVLVVYCQKRRDVVSKSTSQDQPLANSHSQGTASRESFTSNNRQTMVHTSFMDGAGVNDHDYDREFKDIDEETTHGLFSSDGAAPTNNSLRTHKKRPSYHMMQQNYEDGNLIISQI